MTKQVCPETNGYSVTDGQCSECGGVHTATHAELVDALSELLHLVETPGDFNEEDKSNAIHDAAIVLSKVRK